MAEELTVVSLVVADNLLRRDAYHALDIRAMEEMRRKLPGSTFTRDHNTRQSGYKTARIFDSRLTMVDDVSFDLLDIDGHGEVNREIVSRTGGYIQLWVDIYFDQKCSLTKRLRYGKESEISYHGSFINARLRCANCTCANPEGIWGSDCPYLPSNVPWELFLTEEELQDNPVSPYEVLEASGFDPLETSFVTVPAYARSGVVPQKEERL